MGSRSKTANRVPSILSHCLRRLHQLLDFGKPRAAFLIAWSAIESTMRTAARREELEIEEGAPRFVLKTLYSRRGNVVTRTMIDYNIAWTKRNRLVHGLSVNHLEPARCPVHDRVRKAASVPVTRLGGCMIRRSASGTNRETRIAYIWPVHTPGLSAPSSTAASASGRWLPIKSLDPSVSSSRTPRLPGR